MVSKPNIGDTGWGTTLNAALDSLDTAVTTNTAAIGQRWIVVSHGSTASTARPTSSLPVMWQGTVAPTNGITRDRWYDETTEVEKRYDGTTWQVAGKGTYAMERVARPGRTYPAPVVATNCYPLAFRSTASIAAGTSRVPHVATADCTDIRLVYTNMTAFVGASPIVDGDGPNAYTVSGSVEVGGVIYRVTFGGRTSATIDQGGMVVSDPLGIEIATGTRFFTRTYQAATNWYANTASYSAGGGTGGWSTSDLTAPGAAAVPDASAYQYGPAAILGTTTTRPLPTVAIVGDSIFAGYLDAGAVGSGGPSSSWSFNYNPAGGVAARGLSTSVPWVNISREGDRAQWWTALASHYRRAGLLNGMTHAICGFGRNDLDGGRTLVQIQTDLQAVWALLARRGMKVYQSTITPKTTSTDAWATTGNQTVAATEAIRTGLNDWIRTTPTGLTGYFDVADAVETSRNSGIWKVAGGAWTTDGTHPNGALGYPAAATAILPASLTLP